jgi:hypothetical protein
MRIQGFIGADLVGGSESEEGGIGPLFKERLKTEEQDALYVLERIGRALRALKIDDVTSLWIGETGVVEMEPGEAASVDDTLAEAKRGDGYAEYAELHLMISAEDEHLLHSINISYAQVHDPDEAALEALDSAIVLELEVLEDETQEAFEERLNTFLEQFESLDDLSAHCIELERPFVERLLEALRKELSLWEPESSVEVDYQGLATLDDIYSDALAIAAGSAGPPA